MDEEENEHPRPWIQGEVCPSTVYDEEGRSVAICRDESIAALIVRLVNESEQ